MYLRIKDADGNPLRMGDRVLLKDEKASYYGIIERDREFCVPMVRVLNLTPAHLAASSIQSRFSQTVPMCGPRWPTMLTLPVCGWPAAVTCPD